MRYEKFDFLNPENIQQEVQTIALIPDDNQAIVTAFYFQKGYVNALIRSGKFTGYKAIEASLNYIRYWMHNYDEKTNQRIDFLWGIK